VRDIVGVCLDRQGFDDKVGGGSFGPVGLRWPRRGKGFLDQFALGVEHDQVVSVDAYHFRQGQFQRLPAVPGGGYGGELAGDIGDRVCSANIRAEMV
jgi:hypothetical protein